MKWNGVGWALVSPGGAIVCRISYSSLIFELNLGFSENYEGGVSLGMFFMSNGRGIMPKFNLEVDLWWVWGGDL